MSPDPFIRAGYPQYKGNDGIFASIESLESSNDRIYSKANERKERLILPLLKCNSKDIIRNRACSKRK